jgi:hypothetical protein
MGLDDLGWVEFAVPVLALLITLLVSGPATLLSYGAWKLSRSLLAKGHGVSVSRVASVLALAVTGLPITYTLALVLSFPGFLGVAGLLLVLTLALVALVHAAFRDESIRTMGADQELAEKLAPLEVWEREVWFREAGRNALPSFTGTTRRRALKRAATAALLWIAPYALFFLIR